MTPTHRLRRMGALGRVYWGYWCREDGWTLNGVVPAIYSSRRAWTGNGCDRRHRLHRQCGPRALRLVLP